MEHGTAVHSRSSASSTPASITSSKNYVDNAENRRLGRVGEPLGSMPHSRSSAKTPTTGVYVDNAPNRAAGRVGLPYGSGASAPSIKTGSVTQAKVERKYVDNAYNRRLNRVGLPFGSAVQSSSKSASASTRAPATVPQTKEKRKYVDNAINRRLNRVGMPLGSMPVSSKKVIQIDETKLRELISELLAGACGENATQRQDGGDCEPQCFNASDMQEAYERIQQQKLEAEERYDDEAVSRYERMEGIVNRCDASRKNEYTKRFVPEWMKSGDVIDFNDLELGDKLGGGGFGDVHVGIWKSEVKVCVKKLRVKRVSQKKKMEFQQEVKILSSLNHPAIISFFGACVETPYLALVMEFMGKGSLNDVLHIELYQFEDPSKFSLINDMIQAVQYIHSLEPHVTHRDIKSMNVLLCDDMKHCKLADFGLAIKDEILSNSSVADHSAVGTVKYSPKEVLEGQRLTSEEYKAVDIYSLAITVIELMTQKEPFDGLNHNQIRKAVIDGDVRDLDLIDQPDLKRLLTECVSIRPSERPSATQFLQQFNFFLTGF